MKGEAGEAEAHALIPMMAYEHGKQAQCVVRRQAEGQAEVVAQCALASGVLRVHHQVKDELEVEAFFAQLAVTAYLHFS